MKTLPPQDLQLLILKPPSCFKIFIFQLKITHNVTMRRAKTKALRKNFYTQKVIYIVKPYHLKTCNYSFHSLLGEIAPILPLQTLNIIKLQVNQTCLSPKRSNSLKNTGIQSCLLEEGVDTIFYLFMCLNQRFSLKELHG